MDSRKNAEKYREKYREFLREVFANPRNHDFTFTCSTVYQPMSLYYVDRQVWSCSSSGLNLIKSLTDGHATT